MLRKHAVKSFALIAAAQMLLSVCSIGSAREYCGGRGLFGQRGGSGHGLGLFKKDPPSPYPQPKRYYDSTGRWTGDGVDTMSTAPRDRNPNAPAWTFHPN